MNENWSIVAKKMLREQKLLHSFKTGILKLTKVILVWMDNLTKYKYRKSYMNGDRAEDEERKNERQTVDHIYSTCGPRVTSCLWALNFWPGVNVYLLLCRLLEADKERRCATHNITWLWKKKKALLYRFWGATLIISSYYHQRSSVNAAQYFSP